jgi:hypothetical protein
VDGPKTSWLTPWNGEDDSAGAERTDAGLAKMAGHIGRFQFFPFSHPVFDVPITCSF